MKIRRFVADSFQEAMNRAKNEMGRDAIILHSRKFKQGGFLGLFARQMFEITVAVDEDARTSLDVARIDREPEPQPELYLEPEPEPKVLKVVPPRKKEIVFEEVNEPEYVDEPSDSVIDELRS
ncbi:MAG: hypothetical protein ACM3QW_01505, partial [Ignavibacteriales bacterium]